MARSTTVEREQILEKVLAFLAEGSPDDKTAFTASTPLRDGVVIDSLDFVEVIMFLEREFGLSLDPGDLDQLETPAAVTQLIVRKQLR